ncbi:hypothetical protein H2200_002704 [Cladophialophora chaetospira]|uniref:Methyltransferase domain-containing protein n=1 Tax=Cladophialophora chaetospira TaxID=386627 RepID=A0AA38XJD5_9EURO|nr:hypothetical protein H2200_002704 [Cladophialophora chaetospira]
MAAPKDDAMHKMFNSKDFTKMYAEGAEKLTGWFAEELVKAAKLDQVSDDEKLVVLDQACGTGIVSDRLVAGLNAKQKANLDLTCADFADSMIAYVGPRIQTFGLKSAQTVKADAVDTQLPGDKFTHVLLNFGPMIFQDGQAGFRELHRLLQPGGTLGMSSWKQVGWIEDVKAAFATDPEIPAFPPYEDFRKIMNAGGIWDDSEWIQNNVKKSGFVDVHVQEIPHKSSLTSVEEFSRMMAGMVGLIQQTLWSKEQQEKYKDRANEAVVSYMRKTYSDGPIEWDWIAILTTAKKAA